MTWLAHDHARFCRLAFGSPASAATLCRKVGLRVMDVPMPESIDAISIDGVAAIRRSLREQEREHVLLHELGHFLIHGEKGGYHFWRDRDWIMLSKIERQAEEFAYFIALPGDELGLLLWDDVPVGEIAERCGRSVAWVMRRIELACAAGELADWRTRAA